MRRRHSSSSQPPPRGENTSPAATFGLFEGGVAETVRWWVRRRPLVWLASAVLFGAVAGSFAAAGSVAAWRPFTSADDIPPHLFRSQSTLSARVVKVRPGNDGKGHERAQRRLLRKKRLLLVAIVILMCSTSSGACHPRALRPPPGR